MASVSYMEDLTCSVCLNIFTDPVNLPCGHSFCRQCVTEVLNTLQHCPQCRTAVAVEAASLPTSLILKSLAEKAKEEKLRKEGSLKPEVAALCPDHEEKLKLFCITDQQLACIICRDGEEHEGHRFKPVREAALSLRKHLERFEQYSADDIHAMESLANMQKHEMLKTVNMYQQLMTQISKQFQEMYQFLRRREDEIKSELKHKEEDGIREMTEALEAINNTLSESRELKEKVISALKITEPLSFLKNWTEENQTGSPEDVFRPRVDGLQVVKSSLSLGPYGSHLQFFVWKEMLQVLHPRAELLTLKSNSQGVVVSDDGRSLFCKPRNNPVHAFSFSTAQTFGIHKDFGFNPNPEPRVDLHTACSVGGFGTGQYYWEIDVGSRDYWELGIMHNFLKYDRDSYALCGPNVTTELQFENRPRKIGVYFNGSSKELSFYDGDTMKSIHSVTAAFVDKPVSAVISINYKEPDYNPVMVCWY